MAHSKTNQQQLKQVVAQLPDALKFLDKAFLALARQDQDLLGVKDADVRVLMTALRKQVDSADDFPAFCVTIADQLQDWLESRPDANEPWAGPMWWVEGYLRGCEFFDADLSFEPPKPPPATGLKQLALDVPEGFKVKLDSACIQLTRRGVRIFIIEYDEATFAIRKECYDGYERQMALMPIEMRPPHLVDELDFDFRIGAAKGLRLLQRHNLSQLPVMIHYLLTFGQARVEISVFSTKQTGAKLEEYEALISTLREKQ